MKLTCSATELGKACGIVAGVVPARTPKPILKFALLEASNGKLSLTATDLEQSIETSLSATIESTGVVVVSPELLGNLARETDAATISLEVVGNSLRVTLRNGHFDIPLQDESVFPRSTKPDGEAFVIVDPETLRNMLNRTCFAVGETSRYALGAILFDVNGDLSLVATDGKRLAVTKSEAQIGEIPEGLKLIPSVAARHIRKLCTGENPVEIFGGDKALWFVQDDMCYYTRLVEGRFPRYEGIFPKGLDIETTVIAGPLRSVIRQASLATNETSKGITFRFSPNGIALSARSDSCGSSEFTIESGKCDAEFAMVLDGTLVMDALQSVGDDMELTLRLDSKGKKACVFSTTDGFQYVVMPLTEKKEKVAA